MAPQSMPTPGDLYAAQSGRGEGDVDKLKEEVTALLEQPTADAAEEARVLAQAHELVHQALERKVEGS
ncbi:hypothetical protein [Corynebacterium sp. TAE3-ERU2]|uniref:hypothetical protein n=2 Tax=Corynebacteriaceae TaxID=1653 RepID=UPI00124F4208|nr:hypothetical protein [Corynebacterium sp. TAE3-ERU2]MBV7302525.1 hypothetical protein [Corynebacterium sp. TAE3-ERU2]